jgi:hydrogenase/urease accessory protein HupE
MRTRFHVGRFRLIAAMLLLCIWAAGGTAQAHLLVNNAMDVVVGRESVRVDARISLSQVWAVETHGSSEPTPEQWAVLVVSHRAYLLAHLHLKADGNELVARPAPANQPAGVLQATKSASEMACYHIEYPLTAAPTLLRIQQDCLREYEPSDAAFVLRMRQEDQGEFETAELRRDGHAEFDCHWPQVRSPNVPAADSRVDFAATARAFLAQGIWHILTGYDHLLFVTGLVLAASSLWDLVKVVAAFTLAHTLTLTLCVLNIVTLSSRVVEPMISASIVIVALQNIFWPKRSSGWSRLGIAFAFGLFHGLGFAGGLKDAMSELPATALWRALICFSLGVELGHQVVVLPLYALLRRNRRSSGGESQPAATGPWQRWGSCAVCVAGAYFLCQALYPSV